MTERLHRDSFAMHRKLAETFELESFRGLPALRVDAESRKTTPRRAVSPTWLDGKSCDAEMLDEESAQVDPRELSAAFLSAAQASGHCDLRTGKECVGILTEASGAGPVSYTHLTLPTILLV